jgi:hypothetical protein
VVGPHGGATAGGARLRPALPRLRLADGAGTAHRRGDATPYLEREAMEALTIGLTVLLDGIQAAVARDRR